MMDIETLLPCPFCGAAARFYEGHFDALAERNGVTSYGVTCSQGCVETGLWRGDDRDGPRGLWNTRMGANDARPDLLRLADATEQLRQEYNRVLEATISDEALAVLRRLNWGLQRLALAREVALRSLTKMNTGVPQ